MKNKCALNSYEEYLLFLYIYLASSDFSVHMLEIESIFIKMKNLFPHESNLDEVYKKIKSKYDRLELEEIEDLIEQNFKIFKAQLSNPEQLFEDFYDIITSDGIVQDYEIEALDKIKKLLNR